MTDKAPTVGTPTPPRYVDSLAGDVLRIAIKWLMWDGGKTEYEAGVALEGWPDHGEASSAVDIATFIVESRNGDKTPYQGPADVCPSHANPRLIQRCRHAPRWAAEEIESLGAYLARLSSEASRSQC